MAGVPGHHTQLCAPLVPLSGDLVPRIHWGGRESSTGVPFPPPPTMCSPSVPSASLSSSWSTVPTPENLPPSCPHLPPSLLFSKTGIILHIFFPSPKIGKRREQLIWSSWCFCYLTKISFAVILSLVVPHICTASFYLSPALPPPRGTISSSAAGIQSAEGTPSQKCPGPAGMFTSFRVHIVGPSLLSVSFSTSHSR